MITLGELVDQLTELRNKHGGDCPVAVRERTLTEIEVITEFFTDLPCVRLWSKPDYSSWLTGAEHRRRDAE